MWLKKTFVGTRDEMIDEIDQLLQEASKLDVAEGQPFPIVPVTLLLKAIKSELENAVKGPGSAGSQTRMATIPVASYALLIDQYLVNSQYESAWKRTDALKDLISKDRPGSFFARFKKLHEQWANGVKDYKQAAAAWSVLSTFAGERWYKDDGRLCPRTRHGKAAEIWKPSRGQEPAYDDDRRS